MRTKNFYKLIIMQIFFLFLSKETFYHTSMFENLKKEEKGMTLFQIQQRHTHTHTHKERSTKYISHLH